jgi:hypothetical protein
VARVIGDRDARTMAGFVREVAKDRVSLVIADEAQTFENLGLPYESVTQSRDECARGNIHTKNIESFWSRLKRGVVGTCHKVSKDYLPLDLD